MTNTFRNGGAAVVETLRAHSVDTVFGIPGTHNLELYRHLTRLGIDHVTPRHEQGAGYAADGYARVSGKPGVVITTSGPGLTNVITAAATAYADSVPLLVVSPGTPRGLRGHDIGYLHETKDSTGALDRLLRWSRRVSSPTEAADAIAEAFTSFTGARPRPVHVEIPVDVLDEPWAGASPLPHERPGPQADPAALEAAASALAAARSPLIIAGGGSVQASEALKLLAEHCGAPVVTTCNGKGVLPESHPLSVGAAIRLRAAQQAVTAADVVLAVGTELGDSDLWGGTLSARFVIRIDIDAGQLGKNLAADVTLHGDAHRVLAALAERVGPWSDLRHESEAGGLTASAKARARGLRDVCAAEARTDALTVRPLVDAVREALPPDTIMAGDSSQVTYYGAMHFLPVERPNSLLYMPGYATLGYGLPAAIGAKVAAPDRPVIAMMGDGAFLFSVQELATAVQLRLPIPIVVADNGGYAEIRDAMDSRGIPRVGVDLETPDLPALGRAFGAYGIQAETPADVTTAVAKAFTADRPTLVAIRTE
jgi:thiamine pyrophosphate-dependent acetolactate synthase large subunit-like protein